MARQEPSFLGFKLLSFFVNSATGDAYSFGARSPIYAYPLHLIFGVEVLASTLLMALVLVVVYTRGLRGFSGIVIRAVVGFDIFFLALISGASMNPARSLPTLFSGKVVENQ